MYYVIGIAQHGTPYALFSRTNTNTPRVYTSRNRAEGVAASLQNTMLEQANELEYVDPYSLHQHYVGLEYFAIPLESARTWVR